MTACFAEYVVVDAAGTIPLPDVLPLWQAALLGCGVVTGVGAVRNAARVRIGESVCVVGCGGVGLYVVAGAAPGRGRADRRHRPRPREARARSAPRATDAVAAVLEASAGGVDHAFEVSAGRETIRLAWDVLRPSGTAIVVGLAPQGVEVTLPANDPVPAPRVLVASLTAMLEVALAHLLCHRLGALVVASAQVVTV